MHVLVYAVRGGACAAAGRPPQPPQPLLPQAVPAVTVNCGSDAEVPATAMVPSRDEEAAMDEQHLQRHASGLTRMLSLHFSVGFRLVYCAVPFAFAGAGPTALLTTTFAMLLFLWYVDHASADIGGA